MKQQEVKVIELVGQKLDPKAKYLFVVNQAALNESQLDFLHQQLMQLIGPNFVLTITQVPIEDTLKVYEVMP